MAKYVEDAWLETEVCCTCGMLFAMAADYQRRRRDDHATFYCPAGHAQHYDGISEVERLKLDLERKNAKLGAAVARASRIANERDQIARAHQKMRVRVANGVCPCCNRSFENLRMHMHSEHPDYGAPQTLRALREAFGLTQHQVAQEAGVRQVAYISNYERGRPVPAEAKQLLDEWVDRQVGA